MHKKIGEGSGSYGTTNHHPVALALLLLLTLTGLVGCLRDSFRPVDGTLDEAIFFEEQSGSRSIPLSGRKHARRSDQQDSGTRIVESTSGEVSGPGGSQTSSEAERDKKTPARPTEPATRIPDPALVDVDSRIRVYLHKDRLQSEHGSSLPDERMTSIRRQRDRLSGFLEQVESVIDARKAAIEAATSGAENAASVLNDFDDQEFALVDAILTDFPEDSDRIEDLTEDHGMYGGVSLWFEREVEKLDAEYKALERSITDEKVQLRLEAWLIQKGGEVALPLRHYNSLDQGPSRNYDRFGLDLPPSELRALREEMAANEAFVKKANAVLDGELEVRDAVTSLLAKQYVEAIEGVETLIDKYSASSLRMQRDALRDTFEAFETEVRSAAEELGAEAAREIRSLPDDLDDWVDERDSSLTRFVTLLARAENLRDLWQNVDYSTLPAAIQETTDVFQQLSRTDWDQLVTDTVQDVNTFLNDKIQSFVDNQATTAAQGVANSEAGQALATAIQSLYEDVTADVANAKKILATAGEGLGSFLVNAGITRKTLDVTLTTIPETFTVDLGDIKDTAIDLRSAPRRDGDYVRVRASLFKGDSDKAFDESTADFKTTQFGWYAKLSPAVVLAAPEELEGGNDGFRFAPSLSWLHHYQPRPDESLADVMAALRPAIGIHAAFLNFDPDTDGDGDNEGDSVQIGLGGTFSLWDGRLQFGGGYNFMAESRDEGQIYYFVGTDLIGILQTAGIVSP